MVQRERQNLMLEEAGALPLKTSLRLWKALMDIMERSMQWIVLTYAFRQVATIFQTVLLI